MLAGAQLCELRLIARPAARPTLTLARTWDPEIDWSVFGADICADRLPCAEPRILGDAEARALVEEHGLGAQLARLEALFVEGRHEMLMMLVEPRLGMRTALAVHSSVAGHLGGRHGFRAGGIRRHAPDDAEGDVVEDALKLARAMSYKNAAAELPMGGCKMTVQCAPINPADHARVGFLAHAIERGRFLAGPDMGTSGELIDALRTRFTRQIVGGSENTFGGTSIPTARGTAIAIREAARVAWQGPLAGRTAAVMGLGQVGLEVAAMLAADGMTIIAADPDPRAIAAARARIGAIEIVSPDRIVDAHADVLVPAAFGGVIDDAAIDRLRCKMVYGPANNILAAATRAEEVRLAQKLAARGILFQAEWTYNTGGVMAGVAEHLLGEAARTLDLTERLERVCGAGTRTLLAEAQAARVTPTEAAYARIERVIYGGGE
jgi:leucine dehydrogenase